MLAFATPDVPRSTLGTPARQDRRRSALPEDTDDRVEILNGPDFRLAAVPAMPHTWEIATRTGSGLGGGFALARLNHADARTWRFDWTKNAKAAVDARSRGSRTRSSAFTAETAGRSTSCSAASNSSNGRPLVVWKDQRILFEKLDPRIRSVEWSGNPDVLEGTRWKPRIRRWRVVLARPDTDAAAGGAPEAGDRAGARRATRSHPVRIAVARARPGARRGDGSSWRSTRPGRVRSMCAIEPDPEKIRTGRDDRAARLGELKKATPRDKDGNERDPLEYRRARLGTLREDGAQVPGRDQDPGEGDRRHSSVSTRSARPRTC